MDNEQSSGEQPKMRWGVVAGEQVPAGLDWDDRRRMRKSLVWGLFFVALGALFLVERLGVLNLPSIGSLWPSVMWVIAVQHAMNGRLGSALMFVVLGGWFFAVEFGWYGMTWHNSWPLALVAVGASMVVGALTGEESRRRDSRRARREAREARGEGSHE